MQETLFAFSLSLSYYAFRPCSTWVPYYSMGGHHHEAICSCGIPGLLTKIHTSKRV